MLCVELVQHGNNATKSLQHSSPHSLLLKARESKPLRVRLESVATKKPALLVCLAVPLQMWHSKFA